MHTYIIVKSFLLYVHTHPETAIKMNFMAVGMLTVLVATVTANSAQYLPKPTVQHLLCFKRVFEVERCPVDIHLRLKTVNATYLRSLS